MTFDDLRRLDPKKIGSWPAMPKLAVLLIILLLIVAASYWFDWKAQVEQIDAEKAKEAQLRTTFVDKKKKALDLPAYRKWTPC
jgi:type IV pilus assembly protein PilO